MSLHADLLRQAGHLANKEPRRPRQASLRRAVSPAYYALFHLLVDQACRFLIRGSDRAELRRAMSRAFEHGEMKAAARSFSGGTLPASLHPVLAGPVPGELKRVCNAFIELQQARHEADYDLTRSYTRREVLDLVSRAEEAFRDWQCVKGTAAGDAFLVTLLVRKRLDR